MARHIFLELIQLGEGTSDTRRRVPVPNLQPAHTDFLRLHSVLERFIHKRQRLISLSKNEQSQTAELTHEALIHHWKRLGEWLDAGRDDKRLKDQIDQAAHNWDKQARQKGSLWQPPNLDLMRAFSERPGNQLSQLQQDFYDE